jgi:hypothetical protein
MATRKDNPALVVGEYRVLQLPGAYPTRTALFAFSSAPLMRATHQQRGANVVQGIMLRPSLRVGHGVQIE